MALEVSHLLSKSPIKILSWAKKKRNNVFLSLKTNSLPLKFAEKADMPNTCTGEKGEDTLFESILCLR